jgi:acetyl esterase/lipase
MKNWIVLAASLLTALSSAALPKAKGTLHFDATKGEPAVLEMPRGEKVNYTSYTGLYYVTNVEDSTYQYLNVFVPEGATQSTPIFLRTYVGGYMASAAGMPQAGDASGRALQEGYVLVIPGTRGRNSTVTKGKKTIYTGRAPKAILDLKAAIRYLRHFDAQMPGDAEKIITDGTSAGGAMSALMGATGNNADYEPYLKAMGAAEERDDVFASVCFCPITDLDHADMAYEWLYGNTDSRKANDAAHRQVTAELSQQFVNYVNSLKLHTPDGTLLTADNYLDFIKREIIRAAQIAKDAGADIPDSLGFKFSSEASFGAPPINGGVQQAHRQAAPMRPRSRRVGEYIVDLDMPTYLNYVTTKTPLKTAPAFDAKGVAGDAATGENEEFGNDKGSSVNFTDYSASKNNTTVSEEVKRYLPLMNPMSQIGKPGVTVAPHWYIRHGAIDRDTSFPIPLNLAMKLMGEGKDVDYLLAWNRPHSGDYALDELFAWIAKIVK